MVVIDILTSVLLWSLVVTVVTVMVANMAMIIMMMLIAVVNGMVVTATLEVVVGGHTLAEPS
jgi:hypothetical protein